MKNLKKGLLPLWAVVLSVFLVNSPSWAEFEEVIYYHNDALGSPVAATDASGQLLWRESYQPYGTRELKESQETDPGTGEIIESAWDETIWYTGKPEESKFGISYFGARWYDPDIGRFLAMDPAEVTPQNIFSFNRYAYANNNPYKFVDPDGRFAHIAIGGAVGALISGGVYAVTTNNFSWGGFAREAAIGAAVGAATAALPGAIAAGSLNFGSKGANIAASLGNAAAAGSAGDVANQALQGNGVDTGKALLAGVANAAGLVAGSVLAKPAKSFATTSIPENPGIPIKSLSGKTFMLGKTPGSTYVDETLQQTLQDVGGASVSQGINSTLKGDKDK